MLKCCNFVSTVVVSCLLLLAGSVTAEDEEPATASPKTGLDQPDLAKLDQWIGGFMAKHKIPGGSLAVVKDGRLVYVRGFGYADREKKTPVEPTSLFRIASISKPITAVAVMQLVEQGKLKTSDRIVDVLEIEPHLEPGGKLDPRWKQITVEHCLTHTGGWDREKSYDPMFQAVRMAKSMKIDLPVRPEHIICYMRGQPLDFDPGGRYVYSNFGYSLLGRVIEKVSGQSYEKYVQQKVFAPLGIRTPRIGGSLESQRAKGEVRYYDLHNAKGLAIVGPGAGKVQVPISYGVWCQETLDSHGGWIASTTDLVRFAAALDNPRGKLLQAETLKEMFHSHLEIPSGDRKDHNVAYGFGWVVRSDDNGGRIAQHGGALPCTCATLARLPGNLHVAVLFNLGQTPKGEWLGRFVGDELIEVATSIDRWPQHNLINKK